MVKANGRNVSKGIAVKDGLTFLTNARSMGLSFSTLSKLGQQIFLEQFNKDRVVQERTSQVEIAFDLFFDQQLKTNPDVSFSSQTM